MKKLVSKKKSGWLEKAKWRKENEEWLDISFKISVKVLTALKANKATDTYPKNQKELAEALDCSPQYISKLLKGQERLGIDTITKVGKILGLKLIDVHQEEMKITDSYHKISDVVAFSRVEFDNGDWYEYTYDIRDNKSTHKHSKGFWSEITYDEQGNELTYKDSDGLFKIKDKEVIEEEFNNFINSKQ